MLEDAGFRVRETTKSDTDAPRDQVVDTRSAEDAGPGSTITLVVSDGSKKRVSTTPSTPSASPTSPAAEAEEEPAPEEVDLGQLADELANLFR